MAILVIVDTGRTICGFDPGGATGIHNTVFSSLEIASVPSTFLPSGALYEVELLGGAMSPPCDKVVMNEDDSHILYQNLEIVRE